MKILSHVAMLLATIGALNWGLVGALDYNLVEALFGAWPLLVSVIYDLVGLAGIFLAYQMIMCIMGKGGIVIAGGCCGEDCKK